MRTASYRKKGCAIDEHMLERRQRGIVAEQPAQSSPRPSGPERRPAAHMAFVGGFAAPGVRVRGTVRSRAADRRGEPRLSTRKSAGLVSRRDRSSGDPRRSGGAGCSRAPQQQPLCWRENALASELGRSVCTRRRPQDTSSRARSASRVGSSALSSVSSLPVPSRGMSQSSRSGTLK